MRRHNWSWTILLSLVVGRAASVEEAVLAVCEAPSRLRAVEER
jgi:hypothetical protein